MKRGPYDNYGCLSQQFSDLKKSKIVIIPVPYDETSSWGKGADRGPDALIDASGYLELYDDETDSEVYKHGMFTDKPVAEKSTPQAMINAVRATVSGHLKNEKFPIVLGGEHTVTIGSVQAHAAYHKNVSVLQLDAHSDLRDEYEGNPLSHACVMAHVQKVCPIVQVGIRSCDSSEKKYFEKNRMFFAQDIYHHHAWIDAVVSQLSENVYITIDLDVFDPAFMPSTGTPEPGGLGWYDVLALLKAVAQHKNIVGADIVELAPSPHNRAPDFLAAKLLYKLLTYKFELKKKQ